MAETNQSIRFAVCVSNAGYPVSLELQKIYKVLPGEDVETDGDLRVVDESGEDYLYPADYFVLMDVAASVHYLMRNLMSRPPKIAAIRSDIEGLSEEEVFKALDAIQSAHHTGHGSADPYKNFRWNLSRRSRSSRRRESSQILSDLDRMRD